MIYVIRRRGHRGGGGFGWLSVPPRQKLQRYWRGCLLIDDRKVVISRVDGVIADQPSYTLPLNNEAQAAIGTLTAHFVALPEGLHLGGQIREAERWAVDLG